MKNNSADWLAALASPFGGVSHQRGNAFSRPQGGCMVFAAKGGIKNGAEGAVPRQRSDTI